MSLYNLLGQNQLADLCPCGSVKVFLVLVQLQCFHLMFDFICKVFVRCECVRHATLTAYTPVRTERDYEVSEWAD